MEKHIKSKSVSNLLDARFNKIKLSGKRGRALHEVRVQYFKRIFKTADRYNKLNYRNFSQRLSKAKTDILTEFKINSNYSIYYEDVKILLNQLHKSIRILAKKLAQENYHVVIPRQIESQYFGGEAYFEYDAIGKIGGFKVPARTDCLIEIDSKSFNIQDFKSYEINKEDEPGDPESRYHREFMQVCLYAIIFEKERNQICHTIELIYFPNNKVSYEFTDELRETAKKYVMDTAFEGFEGISFKFPPVGEDPLELRDKQITDNHPEIPEKQGSTCHISNNNDEELGWINTIKGKPLQLIMGQDNKMEGFLYPNKAHRVKVGYCLIVEKEDDGVRIMCLVKKIECSEDCFPGETSSHKEENYKIILVPEGQFTPEVYQDLLPQTIIGGKIKIPRTDEFCDFRKIPQNGLPLGNIQGLNAGIPYPMELKTMYQSVFASGQQGTGKTTAIKSMALQIVHTQDAPAQIILDNEGEYRDLRDIPTNSEAKEEMEKFHIKQPELGQFRMINIDPHGDYCLTLKAIDPVDLPYFLHELTAISHDTLQTIIYDIVEDNRGKTFTLPELIKEIYVYMTREQYGVVSSTQNAIKRSLNSIALRIFDVPGVNPLDHEKLLQSGKIKVINTYNLRDSHQRIVGLYLLAILHKRALKGKERLNVIFYLDEIQRLIPKSKSSSDSEYQKRIIKFLSEVVHRGRKRDYGVVFATQSVADVKKEIIDLCNTKLFFQTQGSGINYIKEYFSNKEDLERLKKLPIGHAFITSKGKHEPVEIKFPNIK